MKQRKISAAVYAVAAMMVLGVLGGCTFIFNEPLEIKGTWVQYAGEQSIKLYITNASIQFFEDSADRIKGTGEVVLEGKVVDFDNANWNGGESEETNCGYMIVQYSSSRENISNMANKFGVIRWAGYDPDADPEVMWYAEGVVDPDLDGDADLFNSAEEAGAGMTIDTDRFYDFDNGSFAFRLMEKL